MIIYTFSTEVARVAEEIFSEFEMILEIANLEFSDSSMYPSQTVSDFHLPALFKVSLPTPLSSKIVAPVLL
jgi:hypothetical protein